MKVYITGDKPRRQASFIMCVAPAATVSGSEIPQEWLDAKGNPAQMTVEFIYGEAEVASNLGEYLLDAGLVKKTKMLMPRLEDLGPEPSYAELLAHIQRTEAL
jgi:hypothetical protein